MTISVTVEKQYRYRVKAALNSDGVLTVSILTTDAGEDFKDVQAVIDQEGLDDEVLADIKEALQAAFDSVQDRAVIAADEATSEAKTVARRRGEL